MKELPLSQGRVALVDDEDFEWLNQWKWSLNPTGKGYAYRGIYLGMVDGKTKLGHVAMHRLIMNAPNGLTVDHIDGNGLNNQRHNLRIATYAQNSVNSPKRADSGNPYKGVFRVPNSPRWRVVIGGRGNITRSKPFDTPEEAAREYDRLARERYGDFAYLNFPAD